MAEIPRAQWDIDLEARATRANAHPLLSLYVALGGSPRGIPARNHMKVGCLHHVESTPSLALYDDGHFHAYCCKNGHGNAIDLVQWVKNIPFNEAIEWIEQQAVEVPKMEYIRLHHRGSRGFMKDGRLRTSITRVTNFDYYDEENNPYIRVVRTDLFEVDAGVPSNNMYGINGEILGRKKTFMQMHAHQGSEERCAVCRQCHAPNEWIAGTSIISKAGERVDSMEPLPLWTPEVLRRAQDGEIIFFVEGEKVARALSGCGLLTTTVHGGWTMRLRERALAVLAHAPGVVIIPDYDVSGMNGAKIWQAIMREAGINAVVDAKAYERMRPYVGDIPLKSDFADFILPYESRDQIEEIQNILWSVFPPEKMYPYFSAAIPESILARLHPPSSSDPPDDIDPAGVSCAGDVELAGDADVEPSLSADVPLASTPEAVVIEDSSIAIAPSDFGGCSI